MINQGKGRSGGNRIRIRSFNPTSTTLSLTGVCGSKEVEGGKVVTIVDIVVVEGSRVVVVVNLGRNVVVGTTGVVVVDNEAGVGVVK